MAVRSIDYSNAGLQSECAKETKGSVLSRTNERASYKKGYIKWLINNNRYYRKPINNTNLRRFHYIA